MGGGVLLSLVAGAATGGIECFATYPTEYVKTHLQLGGGKYKGMVDCARQTITEHGMLGLYRGMSVLLVGSIPKQGVRWGAFELAAEKSRDEKGLMNTYKRIACGAFAGGMEGAFAVTPAETIKTAFIEDQRGKQQFKGLSHGVSLIIKKEGLRGLYKGTVPTIMKQATNQSIRFPAQFSALKMLTWGDDSKKTSPLYNGIAGVIAGIISVIATQPMDLVKTRMQGQSASKYSSSSQCLLSVVRNEGLFTLYAGTVPRMVRVGANVGLTFTIFPFVKQALNKLAAT